MAYGPNMMSETEFRYIYCKDGFFEAKKLEKYAYLGYFNDIDV